MELSRLLFIELLTQCRDDFEYATTKKSFEDVPRKTQYGICAWSQYIDWEIEFDWLVQKYREHTDGKTSGGHWWPTAYTIERPISFDEIVVECFEPRIAFLSRFIDDLKNDKYLFDELNSQHK